MKCNEDAIRRTSRDSNALFYGTAIWTIAISAAMGIALGVLKANLVGAFR
jgi:hypothetical protein